MARKPIARIRKHLKKVAVSNPMKSFYSRINLNEIISENMIAIISMITMVHVFSLFVICVD